MSAGASLPKYIPPPSVFLLNKPSTRYGTKPLSNKHWELVRTNVKNHRVQDGKENGHRRSLVQSQDAQKELQKYANGGHRGTKHNGTEQQNGRRRSNENHNNRSHNDDEERQVMEHEQLHYAQPDFSKIFDDTDRAQGSKDENQNHSDRPSDDKYSRDKGKKASVSQNRDYDDDVDWQKKVERENGRNYDWSKNRPRNNSVYDPEGTKIRAQKIDQNKSEKRSRENGMPAQTGEMRNGDSRGRNRRTATVQKPELTSQGATQANNFNSEEEKEPGTSGSLKEKEDTSVQLESNEDEHGDEESIGTDGNDEEDESGGLNRKTLKKKLKQLNDAIKKCTPEFAEKLLDVLEKQKSDCSIYFDDICKSYKKNNEPIFSSYSCENGDVTTSTMNSMAKTLGGLIGGVYTKACKGMEAIKDAAEDLLYEIEPEDDGSWSQVGGVNGIRCMSHYDNRIEDHTVYVCSHCFNEVVDRDAHVNVKYFDATFGCPKPKIVIRSFENRPYFCEKLLSSMSAKRRECFLKMYGEKHQMKGGVHCISVIPSMEQEFLEQQERLKSFNAENDHTP